MCRYTHGMLSTVLQVSDGEGEERGVRRGEEGEERRRERRGSREGEK
jgi:VIT1/CCC1 family predicted Fe2+/Mn2+ transporter